MIVLRPREWQRLVAIFCLIVIGFLIVECGAAAGGWLEHAGMLGGALMLPVAWRVDRQRVELRPEAVVVVNFFRNLVIPWTEVERFDYGVGARVVRTDRRVHRISIFEPKSLDLPFVHRQCEHAVRVMEEFREQRQRVGGGEFSGAGAH